MDSEESRPGSSASNSSTNSSRQSSPAPKSPTIESLASPHSSTGGRSRPRSRSSNAAAASPRSPSKSDSDSSSSSSSSDIEKDDSRPVKSNSFSNRSSVERSPNKNANAGSRNPSLSPAHSRESTRENSSSSDRSRSNSRDNKSDRNGGVTINHEDLSDVSDMESDKRVSSLMNNSKQSLIDEGSNSSLVVPVIEEEDECTTNSQDTIMTDLRQKLDKKKIQLNTLDKNSKDKMCVNEINASNVSVNVEEKLEDDLVKAHDEDALDFEAEEGECPDVSKEDDKPSLQNNGEKEKENTNDKSEGEAEDGEELEEGEVSDEDEKRPEETEPKPVCRFYTRGQCTWGMSCRFLHPGVTDKGNYTMFDLVRPVPLTQPSTNGSRNQNFPGHSGDYHDYRTDRTALHHRGPLHHAAPVYPAHHEARALPIEGPVVVESAWERGLRTAKEMMRKANKRKEQDMDFEDKKMNLTLSPDDLEKDPYYLKERGSPPDAAPPYGRHAMYQELPGGVYSPPDRFSRGPAVPQYDEVDPYGRINRYRELPPHRMPQYEDERRVRPTREVIVQRVEPVSRGDEWNDPWMRSKSPTGRGLSRDRNDKRRRDQRSYSSNSSYSSSSSSQSDSSSESSQSRSPADHRRRYNTNSKKSPLSTRRHGVRSSRSPSSPVRRTRHSPIPKFDLRDTKSNVFNKHALCSTEDIHRSPINKRRGHISLSPSLVKRGVHSPPVHKRKKLSPTLNKYMNEKSKTKRRRTSSSSGSDSSDSSGSDSDSDSGSSTSGSSSRSRDHTPPKRLRSTAQDKILNDKKMQRKGDPPKKRSPISIEIKKQATVGASVFTSPSHSISSEKDSKKSRREELLKQLRAVEDAIAKKRSKLA